MSTTAGERSQECTIRATPVRHPVECFSELTHNHASRCHDLCTSRHTRTTTTPYDSRNPTRRVLVRRRRKSCWMMHFPWRPPLPWTAVGRTSHMLVWRALRSRRLGVPSFSRAHAPVARGFIIRQLFRQFVSVPRYRPFGPSKNEMHAYIVLKSYPFLLGTPLFAAEKKCYRSTAELLLLDDHSTLFFLLSTKRNDALQFENC